MKKLAPIVLAVSGLLAGAGAGFVAKPAATMKETGSADTHGEPGESTHKEGKTEPQAADRKESGGEPDYVKLNNQFVVPVVDNGTVSALVVLSISLEVEPGASASVYEREPKLRDAFLRVLFDHANAGGFRGSFTDSVTMTTLRQALREASQNVLGSIAYDVLILDIMRQDS